MSNPITMNTSPEWLRQMAEKEDGTILSTGGLVTRLEGIEKNDTPALADLMKPYEPKGTHFYDIASNQYMLLIADGEDMAGWLCYRHPDGKWVTLRKASEEDKQAILKAGGSE